MVKSQQKILVLDTLFEAGKKIRGAKGCIWTGLFVMGAILGGIYILSFLHHAIFPHNMVVLFLLMVISTKLVQILFGNGLLYVAMQRVQDLKISSFMVYRVFQSDLIFKLAGLYILYFFIMLPTLFILVIGDHLFVYFHLNHLLIKILTVVIYLIVYIYILYFMIRMSTANCFILDKKASPFYAIKLSFQATKGNFWRLLGIIMFMIIVLVISIVPLGLGLIWSIPFLFICEAMIYKNLTALSSPYQSNPSKLENSIGPLK